MRNPVKGENRFKLAEQVEIARLVHIGALPYKGPSLGSLDLWLNSEKRSLIIKKFGDWLNGMQ